MNFKEHCNLCDNIKISLQDGITCGLTDKKPVFNQTCPNILLGKEFEKKIGLLHIELESLKNRKLSIYVYSFLYMLLALIIIVSLIYYGKLFKDSDFAYSIYLELSAYLLVILPLLQLISLAYRKLSRYTHKMKIMKGQQNTINTVLKKYQIEYSYRIEFGKKYHRNQDIIVELKSNSNLLKDSRTTFQI